MTETKGYICDRPECKKFEAGPVLPKGWMTLTISVEVPKPAGGFAETPRTLATNGDRPKFDLCSNACLAALAVERAKASGENVPGVYVRATRSDAGTKRGKKAPE